MDIRLLKSTEIECRVQSTKKSAKSTGCILLLYKDARCDMKILDEVFGNMGWQRTHELINGNLFCNVEVWDLEKKCWIRKQDVGTQSNTEKEKGQASDSFKRACFTLGIGRELYTSPFIWINLNANEISEYNGKTQLSAFVKFSVKSISYNAEREIDGLIIQDNKKVERFVLGKAPVPITDKPTVITETLKSDKPIESPTDKTGSPLITEGQRKRLYALSKANVELIKEVLSKHEYTEAKDIPVSKYKVICDEIEKGAK